MTKTKNLLHFFFIGFEEDLIEISFLARNASQNTFAFDILLHKKL